MRALILGPLEVHAAGGPVAMTARQRAIVAVLLLRRGTPTSAERLVDELWGDAAPATAIKSVQVRIAELRRVLPPGTLMSGPRGYLLAPLDVDADRFEALLADGDPGAALALWRGEVLDGIDTPAAREEAQRLESLRLIALERRADAELAAGRAAELVPGLERMLREHPLRERPRAQLMLALYRAGRQADALAAYREGRARMDALGLVPGRELRDLEVAILRQDPALDRPTPAPRDAQRTRRTTVAAVVLAAAFVAASLALIHPGGGHATPTSRVPLVPADSLAIIDPAANTVTGVVPVGADPVAVAVGDGALWVADGGDQTVTRVDPVHRAVTGTFRTGGIPTAVTVDRRTVWIANGTTGDGVGTVSRVEPSTGISTTATVRPDSEDTTFDARTPSAVTVAGGSVWVNDVGRRLQRLSRGSGDPVGRVSLGRSSSADGLTAYRGSIWAASGADDQVLRIDPASGAVRARIAIAAAPGERVAGPSSVAGGFGSVWVTDTLSGTISRVDPRLNAVTATIRVGARPTRVAAGEGAVWVLDAGRAAIVRIDPRRDLVTRTIFVGGQPTALTSAAGQIWVTMAGDRAPRRAPSPPATPRPVVQAACAPPAPAAGARRIIVSDLPSYVAGQPSATIAQMRQAIRRVLAQHGDRAGRYPVAYQACDDSSAETGTSDPARCFANARAYSADPSVVGMVGPYDSDCARLELPVLDAGTSGPLGAVAPTLTYEGLTRSGPGTEVDEPERYYPTGQRNLVRLTGPDDAQGAALGLLARELGTRRLYLLHDGGPYGYALARYLERAAGRLAIPLAGLSAWDPGARDYAALARAVRRSGADTVALLGCLCSNGIALMGALRHGLSPTVRLIAADGFTPWNGRLPRTAGDVYFTAATAPGRQPRRDARSPEARSAAAATEILLAALSRSDGTRSGVTAALMRAGSVQTSLGALHFDAGGDIRDPRFAVLRTGAEGGALRHDRVITARLRAGG